MGTMGAAWGRCSSCGKDLGSIMRRGTCSDCVRTRDQARAENLRQDPDLAEVERVMEDFQKLWDGVET